MEKTREELSRMHKEKCRELKEMRAKMAENLGIDLKQRECTYEGYCSGTCPRCKSEELRLNAALLGKQMQETDIKRRVATAGLMTAAALSLSGCGRNWESLEGDVVATPDYDNMQIEGMEEEGDREYLVDTEVLEGEDVEETELMRAIEEAGMTEDTEERMSERTEESSDE